MADRAHLERLQKELADKGKLIEAGWLGLRIAAVSPAAPAIQLDEMRMAFFAGALLTSIMTILDPDADPTENDFRRMSLIQGELDAFIKDFELRHATTKGSA